MRLRSGNIFFIVIVAIGCFVLFLALRAPHPLPEEEPVASLPPEGAAQDLVPIIETETTDYQMGLIPNNDLGHGTLKIRNRGKVNLRILDVRTSCACTYGRMAAGNDNIAPGGEGVLEITVDPARIYGFHSKKTLTVATNDPATPHVNITVSVDITPEFEVVPDTPDFGAIPKGKEATLNLTVRQLMDVPLEVKNVAVNAAAAGPWNDCTVAWNPVPQEAWRQPGRAEFTVTITMSPETVAGPFTRNLEIETTVPRVPRLAVPVTGTVDAPYEVAPQFPKLLVLIALGKARPEPMAISVRSRDTAQPLAVDRIIIDPPVISLTPEPGTDPGLVKLNAALVPGTAAGRHEGTVKFVVRVNDAEYREQVAFRVVAGG